MNIHKLKDKIKNINRKLRTKHKKLYIVKQEIQELETSRNNANALLFSMREERKKKKSKK